MKESLSKTALVLAPHPDDESLGCGGTIKLITQSGGAVDVLFMTRGDLGFFPGSASLTDPAQIESARAALARQRSAEARAACDVLGVRDIAFLPGRDGGLTQQPELSDHVLAALRDRAYRSVFCPWPLDNHADHVATYRILHSALARHANELEVWLYEVWTPLQRPNISIGIDETIEAKFKAFAAHESQSTLLSYEQAFRGLASYRGLSNPPSRFAEAFFNIDSKSLVGHDGVPWPKPVGV